MTQYTHESHANVNPMGTLKNPLPHHITPHLIISRLKMRTVWFLMQTLKMNVITVKCSRANHSLIAHHNRSRETYFNTC